MTAPTAPATPTGLVVASVPVATAIGVFGLVYGAVARPVLGPVATVVSSVLVFSGAAQFTVVALATAGAAPLAIVGGAAMLALRHLPLGALLRPRLTVGRPRRALLSWFLIDETTGLALTRAEPTERTLVTAGSMAYVAWVLGTVGGVAGAALPAAEPLAEALFPVLFVGLAALTATTRGDVARALVAGVTAFGVLLAWPAAGAPGAISVAVAVAAVGGRT